MTHEVFNPIPTVGVSPKIEETHPKMDDLQWINHIKIDDLGGKLVPLFFGFPSSPGYETAIVQHTRTHLCLPHRRPRSGSNKTSQAPSRKRSHMDGDSWFP